MTQCFFKPIIILQRDLISNTRYPFKLFENRTGYLFLSPGFQAARTLCIYQVLLVLNIFMKDMAHEES